MRKFSPSEPSKDSIVPARRLCRARKELGLIKTAVFLIDRKTGEGWCEEIADSADCVSISADESTGEMSRVRERLERTHC